MKRIIGLIMSITILMNIGLVAFATGDQSVSENESTAKVSVSGTINDSYKVRLPMSINLNATKGSYLYSELKVECVGNIAVNKYIEVKTNEKIKGRNKEGTETIDIYAIATINGASSITDTNLENKIEKIKNSNNEISIIFKEDTEKERGENIEGTTGKYIDDKNYTSIPIMVATKDDFPAGDYEGKMQFSISIKED